MSEHEAQQQMAKDIREIKQAVIGDPSIGLNGLVNDMRDMKQFRNSIVLKVAFVSGIISVAVVGGPKILAAMFNLKF